MVLFQETITLFKQHLVGSFNMFKTLMSKLGRYRIIKDRIGDDIYLERYYLFLRDRNTFPFNIFLHKFKKSDPDDLHDHPWNYRTIVIKGGYWETTPEGKFWRGVGHYRFCEARSLHRIELEKDVDCWTLFIPGKYKREWGFMTNNKWVQWEEYLYNRKKESA